jgi:ubiquinone/menaquinone biosynthesis C-methylase UbiE
MTAKDYYKSYIADDGISQLSERLIDTIVSHNPIVVLDYGSGSGKHCNILRNKGIYTISTDVSMMNVVRAYSKYDLPNVICSYESILKFFVGIDLVFTCSVLDHIENISMIIDEFKRIGKVVILAETKDVPGDLYFSHDYENYGFTKLDFEYVSEKPEGDGATYHIWKWVKGQKENMHSQDDLG